MAGDGSAGPAPPDRADGWAYTTAAYGAATDDDVTAKSAAWLEEQAQFPFIREVGRRSAELLDLRAGAHVLEVGCGTGVFLPRLAAAVGDGGRVVGLDHSPQFLAQARSRLDGLGVPGVELVEGDALGLPFPDGTFDATHCERVLMHLGDMTAAIAEMVRVVRPGGRVVAAEVYANAAAIDVPHPLAMRRVMHELVSGIANPDAGIQLRRRFVEAGLVDVTGTVVADFEEDLDAEESTEIAALADRLTAAGEIEPHAGRAIVEAMRSQLASGTHCGTALIFVVAGSVPGDSPD